MPICWHQYALFDLNNVELPVKPVTLACIVDELYKLNLLFSTTGISDIEKHYLCFLFLATAYTHCSVCCQRSYLCCPSIYHTCVIYLLSSTIISCIGNIVEVGEHIFQDSKHSDRHCTMSFLCIIYKILTNKVTISQIKIINFAYHIYE
jgi:hypothetical protein